MNTILYLSVEYTPGPESNEIILTEDKKVSDDVNYFKINLLALVS